MASVNYEKIKSVSTLKAQFRHCDAEQRLKHKHANKEIDVEQTHKNINYMKVGYDGSCKRFDDRIKELDNSTNTNHRSDRVICFGLSVPAPEGIEDKDYRTFFAEVVKIIANKYGLDNIMQANVHLDEIHNYINSAGEVKTSRPHLHCYVVPEHNGILNGKWFSSRKNMMDLNKKIETMCQEKYNCKFMTNEKARKLSVEELKRLSNAEVGTRERLVEQIAVAEQQIKHLEKAVEGISRYATNHNDVKLMDYTDRVLDFKLLKKNIKNMKDTVKHYDDIER